MPCGDSSTAPRSTPVTTAWGAASRPPGCGARTPGHKRYDVDSSFEDQDHEWYDHDADPLELVNLAQDPARRARMRELFERLRSYEADEMDVSA